MIYPKFLNALDDKRAFTVILPLSNSCAKATF